MIGWIIVLGSWLAGVLLTWIWAGRDIHAATQEEMGIEKAEQHRGSNFTIGLFLGLVWPVSVPVLVVWTLLTPVVNRLSRTSIDRESAERQELERLREQAKALGLPYPGEDR